jgi:hypothetical protein
VGQRGQSLIESIVAAAIATVVASVTLGAAVAASAHFGPDPAQSALTSAVRREMSVARDLTKYEGAVLQARSIPTSVPFPDGSPLPATISLNASTLPSGAVAITITASASWHNAQRSFSLSSTLLAPAPVPGSTIPLAGLVPAPTGAP